MPTVREAKALFHTYSWKTGVGTDWWQPRVLAYLPDERIGELIRFWEVCLRSAVMPTQVSLLLIHLIPKPDSSDRPIGVFPTFHRAPSKWCRRMYGKQWQQRQPTFAQSAIDQKPLEQAVWLHAAVAEWSRYTGRDAASFLLDLTKAFEHITDGHLYREARRCGFSEGVLRWLLHIYRMPRTLIFMQIVTTTVRAWRSIVPGDAFADLMRPLRRRCLRW